MKSQELLERKDEEQIITASVPEKSHDPHYKKEQVFSFISNQSLSNYVLMPGCGVFWVGGFLFSNQNKISPIESNYARYVVQVFSQILIMAIRRQSVSFRNIRDFKLLVLRGVISAFNGLAASFFQMFLPLTVYYTINASTTIFAFILNYFLFGIHVTRNQKISIFAGIIGIILVINGRAIYSWLFSQYEFTSNFNYSSSDLLVLGLVGLAVVLWSLVWAYGIIITGKHHASINEFILINAVIGFFMHAIMEAAIPDAAAAPNTNILFTRKPELWLQTLLYTGVPLGTANYIFNSGLFISTNTGISTIIVQINIVYVYIISTIRYDQSINLVCLFGAVLLIGSIYVVLIHK